MNLSFISQGYLNAIARQLNNRPRRYLDDETPLEVFRMKSITQRAALHFELAAYEGIDRTITLPADAAGVLR
jgi:hypothetical protein